MKFKIKHRWSNEALFTADLGAKYENTPYGIQLGAAVKLAVKSGVNLSGANLLGADLLGADLTGADLSCADLSCADLSCADLTEANLTEANLIDANLSGTDLIDARLSGANLSYADLTGTRLSGANLSGADLSGTRLRDVRLSDANLTKIRDDIWAVLSAAPEEAQGLRQALIAGQVDGSTYTGACCCLVGTIARLRGTDINRLNSLKPNSSRPAERFFLAIKRGDTPETNQISALAVEWIDEWLSRMQQAFGAAANKTAGPTT